jgi:hypothetical protein
VHSEKQSLASLRTEAGITIDERTEQNLKAESPMSVRSEFGSKVTFSKREQLAKQREPIWRTGAGMQMAMREEQPVKALVIRPVQRDPGSKVIEERL